MTDTTKPLETEPTEPQGIANFEGTRLLGLVLHFLRSDKRILALQGGTRCFVPDTPVLTPSGYIPIHALGKGDIVITTDPEGNSLRGMVSDTFMYKAESLSHNTVKFTLVNGNTIECTYDHEIRYGNGYSRAIDIAERAMASGRRVRREVQGVEPGAHSDHKLQERNGQADGGLCQGHKEAAQTLRGNGEGLGEGIRSIDCCGEGFAKGQNLAARSIELDDIGEILISTTNETVYDLEVLPYSNYVVSESNIIVHNSGKTYAVAQGLIIEFINQLSMLSHNDSWRLSILRKRMPSLKGTAMRDFFEILRNQDWYDQQFHNKTDHEYTMGPVSVEFTSLDDSQKIRGRKRNIAWLNEANEFSFEDFKQLAFRTSDKLILDYNPSDEFHWIYDKILIRDDIMFDISTYRDNRFLTPEIVKEIEWLREIDENAWRIYGMGERGSSGAAVYPRFHTYKAGTVPVLEDIEPIYGADFGYNNPSSIIELKIGQNEDDEPCIWAKLLLYERKLTNDVFMKRLGDVVKDPHLPIYADSSSPERIEEIRNNGFNILPADKRNHSVKDGIDFIKRHRIYIENNSEDMIREMRGYKWEMSKDERILDTPVKFRDHSLDALRYAAYTHYGRPVQWLLA